MKIEIISAKGDTVTAIVSHDSLKITVDVPNCNVSSLLETEKRIAEYIETNKLKPSPLKKK